MNGMRSYEPKQRRKVRMNNHEKYDLLPRPKRIKARLVKDDHEHWTSHNWLQHLEDD